MPTTIGGRILMPFMCSVLLCCTGKQLRFVDAVEVQIGPTQNAALAALLSSVAKRCELYFQDASKYMLQTTRGQFTTHMTIYRPLADKSEWPEVQVVGERGGTPWVMFLEPANQSVVRSTDQTHSFIVAVLRRRWPDLRSIPILTNGGLPLASDLRWTDEGYRIIPSSAANYRLPPTSPLVARKSGNN